MHIHLKLNPIVDEQMKRLKIVQITQEFSANGGLGVYVLHLCRALEFSGHDNYVIHSDASVLKATNDGKKHYYFEDFFIHQNESKSKKSGNEIISLLESIKPDIIHIQNNHNFYLESEIRKRFPAIKSLHVYDFCPSGNKYHHALQKPCVYPTSAMCLGRLVYKRCMMSKRPWVLWQHYQRAVEANKNNAKYAKLIVASDYVKQQAIASGYPTGQIETLPYFTLLPELPDSVHDGKTILFIGRIVKEKGLDRLLNALSLVKAEWQLVVAGDGFDLNNSKQLAQKLGLAGKVEFVGWVEMELHRQFYRQASIVVVPSVWPEPFGIVGIEAMSYAKPAIAFKVGGIPQWLDDEVTGFLIEPYDVMAMAERIEYLLTHSQEAQEMGKRGREKVEREFVVEHHVKKLLNVYEQVMNTRTACATNSN